MSQNKQTTELSSLDYLGSTTRVNKFENGAWTQTLAIEYDVWGREIQMIDFCGGTLSSPKVPTNERD